jgi:superfamily I DNA and/or RNA helicase
MHPHICEVISRAFYKHKLLTDPNLLDADGNQRAEFRHHLEISAQTGAVTIRELPLVWIDMPWSATDRDFHETGGYANEREAAAVIAFIRALRLSPATNNRYTIAVLTPYRQQLRILQEMLRDERVPNFLDLVSSSGVRNRAERGRWVHTIDSFQGNEADIVVVSLVRNNTMTTARNAFGFLVDPERLNVTLSRAKKLLVVVGSRQFFWNQAVEGEELRPARVVLETFAEFVDHGNATTIPFSLLVPPNKR